MSKHFYVEDMQYPRSYSEHMAQEIAKTLDRLGHHIDTLAGPNTKYANRIKLNRGGMVHFCSNDIEKCSRTWEEQWYNVLSTAIHCAELYGSNNIPRSVESRLKVLIRQSR